MRDLEYVAEQADYDDQVDPDHDGCISCGAEIDHYLGCPDDPNPDYAQEAELAERQAAEAPALLLCWCCAVWGLETPAIDGRKRLCTRCLTSSPAACKQRHMGEAAELAAQAATADA